MCFYHTPPGSIGTPWCPQVSHRCVTPLAFQQGLPRLGVFPKAEDVRKQLKWRSQSTCQGAFCAMGPQLFLPPALVTCIHPALLPLAHTRFLKIGNGDVRPSQAPPNTCVGQHSLISSPPLSRAAQDEWCWRPSGTVRLASTGGPVYHLHPQHSGHLNSANPHEASAIITPTSQKGLRCREVTSCG